MNSVEQAVAAVVLALEELCRRVKSAERGTLCQVGELGATEPVQVYASFLANTSAESLDLCIYFHQTIGKLNVSGDLVRGGSGEVLSEFSDVGLTVATEDGTERWDIAPVRSYIVSQEEKVLEVLRLAGPF